MVYLTIWNFGLWWAALDALHNSAEWLRWAVGHDAALDALDQSVEWLRWAVGHNAGHQGELAILRQSGRNPDEIFWAMVGRTR